MHITELLSHIQLFVILWTVACQTPLSITFSRHEDWSRLPFPSPGDLPDPGTEPECPVASALEGKVLTAGPPGKFQRIVFLLILQIM